MEAIGFVTIDLAEYQAKIIFEDQIIDNNMLRWRFTHTGGIELTLDEISKQLNPTENDMIYVWIESGLRGEIMVYNKCKDKKWYKHGVINGFA